MVRHGARPDFRTLSLLDHKMVRFFVSVREILCSVVLCSQLLQLRNESLKNQACTGFKLFTNIFQLVLMFATNYYQSNVIALCCNFDS